ncbi:methyl-accepting chemotaxis protein [Ferrimonas pelagia]|uniref:Methyl-accepting chemotaxis protein n=1 Tax=Ferrimonas pelagia TaxID=1177826 RepID=A0ABP9F410_9GAMM
MVTLSRLSLSRKLNLLLLLSVIATLSLLSYAAWYTTKDKSSELDKEIASAVHLAHSLVAQYQDREGELGREQAQAMAQETLSGLRYDGDNYFWVVDQQGTLLVHPIRPEQLGQDMRRVTDGQGHYHWQQMLDISAQQGQGFLDYQVMLPGRAAQEKHAYVQHVENWGWVIGTGVDAVDRTALVLAVIINLVWVSIIATLVTQLISHFIRKDIATPIAELEEVCDRLADGDLRPMHPHLRLRGDELGHLAQALGKAQQNLSSLLEQVQGAVYGNREQAQGIAQACQASQEQVNHQQSQLEQVSTAMNEMSVTVSDVAKNAEETAMHTDAVTQHSVQGEHLMMKTEQQITELTQRVRTNSEQIAALQHGVTAINEVTEVIDGISDQTNLLALNAAIEAARAGEQGRGFAVVADEVRQLASRTQHSTSEVKQTVDRLQSDAGQSVAAMAASVGLAEQGVSDTHAMAEALHEMIGLIRQANERSAQIATAAEQQSVVAEQINQNLHNASEAGINVSRYADQLAQSSHALLANAGELEQKLTKFRL